MRLDEFVILGDRFAIDDAFTMIAGCAIGGKFLRVSLFLHINSIPRRQKSPYKIPIDERSARETIWILRIFRAIFGILQLLKIQQLLKFESF